MAFFFGDGFDLYAQISDCGGYWDSAFGSSSVTLSSSGRFAGSRSAAIGPGTGSTPCITKTSGVNDSVHHFSLALQQTLALSGSSFGLFIMLFDGATAQCTILFRSDGAICLYTANGITLLATYTGALAAINTWYQFEIEIVVHNTAGSIAVRKNGNTSNDFFLGSLGTRQSANNYANKAGLGNNWGSPGVQMLDDFLWRSDASSVPWVGDIRCFTRMPVSDVSAQFTRSGSVVPVTPQVGGGSPISTQGNTAWNQPFVASCDGAVGSVTMSIATASTANFKSAIFSNNAGAPGTVLGTATNIVSAPPIGNSTFTFSPAVAVTRGATYWVGFITDATSGAWTGTVSVSAPTIYSMLGVRTSSPAYASWPANNPSVSSAWQTCVIFTANITPTTLSNAGFVADTATDYASGYDYSSTVGQSDLYAIASTITTPGAVVGVTTRVYCQKSDIGTRNLAVQLQSGATNVQTSAALNTSWSWIARNDLTDPATGAAWTASGVNNAQIGVTVTA
jgi:hypothetical protein